MTLNSLANCGTPGNRAPLSGRGYDSRMSRLRPSVLFALVASMACGVMLGTLAFWKLTDYMDKVRDEFMLLTVVREIRDTYIDEVPRSVLVDNAIRGVVAGLDNHSSYLDEDALALMEEDTLGHFGGIGVELELVDGYFTIVSPYDGGPAARAGIRAGDRLVEVDHESLSGRSLTETINGLRGEPGTDVHVRVRRRAGASLDFDLKRDTITVPSVHGRALGGGSATCACRSSTTPRATTSPSSSPACVRTTT